MTNPPKSIPRIAGNNFQPEIIKERQDFIKRETGASMRHTSHMSIDPATLSGNVENPIGVTQMPLGLAGPLLVKGEHAQGHFYVPMATTEGTLVASYSRGMRLLTAAGGVKTTIIERYMQRAPVFHFDDARAARDFRDWLTANFDKVKEVAESTTSVGKLSHIEHYVVAKMCYTRFNFTTGDAAGQNMCSASNNCVHPGNGIASIFIATGQDEANVAEAITGITYTELLPNNDLYWSMTLPSLIVATYGGGTGLATQREALEIMDCYGTGKVEKLIEIIGGAVLAGEISLASAVISDEWVESHDKHGRNRP